jgi:hypothetical protein
VQQRRLLPPGMDNRRLGNRNGPDGALCEAIWTKELDRLIRVYDASESSTSPCVSPEFGKPNCLGRRTNIERAVIGQTEGRTAFLTSKHSLGLVVDRWSPRLSNTVWKCAKARLSDRRLQSGRAGFASSRIAPTQQSDSVDIGRASDWLQSGE